jgi:hypothetical protein
LRRAGEKLHVDHEVAGCGVGRGAREVKGEFDVIALLGDDRGIELDKCVGFLYEAEEYILSVPILYHVFELRVFAVRSGSLPRGQKL